MEAQKEKIPQNLYVRRGQAVKGPFTRGIIRNFVLLGRIKVTDEVSADKAQWTTIRSNPDLIPDEMKNVRTKEDEYKLELAIQRADERRENRKTQFDEAAKQRRAEDRRKPEAIEMIKHRSQRDALARMEASKKSYWIQVIVLLCFVAGLGYGGYYLYVHHENGPSIVANCAAPPAPGLNWSNCHLQNIRVFSKNLKGSKMQNTNFSGADLHGSNLQNSVLLYANLSTANLSYVDFTGARLTGANLRKADMTNAIFKGADLSYVNFTGARMGGVDLTGARLHHAIWIDGRQCQAGSIGSCK